MCQNPNKNVSTSIRSKSIVHRLEMLLTHPNLKGGDAKKPSDEGPFSSSMHAK